MFKRDLDCQIEHCDKKQLAQGLCDMHYRRKRRHGDPNFINPKCNRDGKYLERARVKSNQWKKDHKKLNNSFNANRKKRVKQVTLGCGASSELTQIYLNCPEGHQVDHIIPINHNDVSGLHVAWNLQYLTKKDNSEKSNKFDGTHENDGWRTPQPWKYKPVVAVETGIEYESVSAAAKALNVNRATISSLLKSAKQGRGGISFKFKA